MAVTACTKTIPQLNTLNCSTVATNDLFLVYDTSAGETKAISASNLNCYLSGASDTYVTAAAYTGTGSNQNAQLTLSNSVAVNTDLITPFVKSSGTRGIIGLGHCNSNNSNYSIAAGLSNNIADAHCSINMGGCANLVSSSLSAGIIAGNRNQNCGSVATVIVGGASGLTDNSCCAFMGGGKWSTMHNSHFATMGGGCTNTICGSDMSAIEGGMCNAICGSATRSAIVGGTLLYISGSTNAMHVAGCDNRIQDSTESAMIGGYRNCILNSDRSTIIGGTGITLANCDDTTVVTRLATNATAGGLQWGVSCCNFTAGANTVCVRNGIIVGIS